MTKVAHRGKTIAVTGAARGIGFATAVELLRQGAHVVIGDRDTAQLEVALKRLAAISNSVSGHPLDVTDVDSFAAFLDDVRSDGHGHVDALINNAGVMPVGPFLQQSEQSIDATIDVNIRGVVNGCRLALPEMVHRGRGHIVNVASMAGLIALPGQAVYAASKFAIVGLSGALADEYASTGVTISAVLPPLTNTELIAGTLPARANKPVEPRLVAQAIVGTLGRRSVQVSVPAAARFGAIATALLSLRTRRWLSRRLGTDSLFLEVDTVARQNYEDRARSAHGFTV